MFFRLMDMFRCHQYNVEMLIEDYFLVVNPCSHVLVSAHATLPFLKYTYTLTSII
jgi:hypothetical protein